MYVPVCTQYILGRGKPRLGDLTVEETSERKEAASKSSNQCGKETRERSKGDGA